MRVPVLPAGTEYVSRCISGSTRLGAGAIGTRRGWSASAPPCPFTFKTAMNLKLSAIMFWKTCLVNVFEQSRRPRVNDETTAIVFGNEGSAGCVEKIHKFRRIHDDDLLNELRESLEEAPPHNSVRSCSVCLIRINKPARMETRLGWKARPSRSMTRTAPDCRPDDFSASTTRRWILSMRRYLALMNGVILAFEMNKKAYNEVLDESMNVCAP